MIYEYSRVDKPFLIKCGAINEAGMIKANKFSEFCIKHNITTGFKLIHNDDNTINIEVDKETLKQISKYLLVGEELGVSFYDLMCSILDQVQ